MASTHADHLLAEGRIGGIDGGDPWDWELWSEGDLLVLNMTRPGSGIYEVATALNRDQADRLGKAISTGVGRLMARDLERRRQIAMDYREGRRR